MPGKDDTALSAAIKTMEALAYHLQSAGGLAASLQMQMAMIGGQAAGPELVKEEPKAGLTFYNGEADGTEKGRTKGPKRH